jgi:hypothetical protein
MSRDRMQGQEADDEWTEQEATDAAELWAKLNVPVIDLGQIARDLEESRDYLAPRPSLEPGDLTDIMGRLSAADPTFEITPAGKRALAEDAARVAREADERMRRLADMQAYVVGAQGTVEWGGDGDLLFRRLLQLFAEARGCIGKVVTEDERALLEATCQQYATHCAAMKQAAA